jgi:hypothetical protein
MNDSYALYQCRRWAQVASVTGSKILRVLKSHGLAPEIPEDLYHMIKKISGLLVTARRLRVRKARRHAHCLLVRCHSLLPLRTQCPSASIWSAAARTRTASSGEGRGWQAADLLPHVVLPHMHHAT